jgi:cysteine desulfurase
MSIYLDNAATTPVDPEVLKTMMPYFSKIYGNASEFHHLGRESKIGLETARQIVSKFLSADSKEIIFVSGATESINLALKGLIENLNDYPSKDQLPHIITTSIEHKAVIETCKHLERCNQAEVTYLPVDKNGMIDISTLKKAIKVNTRLVSVMYANNEVGTVEPIHQIGNLLSKLNKQRKNKIYFHTDATQALGYLNCDVTYLGVDLLSFTGHKIYAPKGIGVLYKRKNVSINRQMDGGAQESNKRASTENVASIVGVGKAIELISKNKELETLRLEKLRNKLISQILKIPHTKLTGHKTKRVPHIASFVIDDIEGEAIVIHLSNKKIYASSGSACTAADLSASHVLTAMGIPPEVSHGSLRLSLGRHTTLNDIDTLTKELKLIVKNLRLISPQLEGGEI